MCCQPLPARQCEAIDGKLWQYMARIAGMATPVCIDKYYGLDIIIYATVPRCREGLNAYFAIVWKYVSILFEFRINMIHVRIQMVN